MRRSGEALKQHWDDLSSLPPDQSVIDPNDKRGHKNRYLHEVRDDAFRRALEALPPSAVVLDLGCGSGNGSIGLLRSGRRVLGLDISIPLLQQASARCRTHDAMFVQTDGHTIPVRKFSLDAVVTYGVLIYTLKDSQLNSLLEQLRQSLKPGGRLVLVEQVRRRGRTVEDDLKRFRSPSEWHASLAAAGFVQERFEVLRHGRFPGILLIKNGLIPNFMWPVFKRAERLIGVVSGVLPWDYADAMIIASTPEQ